MKWFYGIDVGERGGIAIVDESGAVVCAVAMPATDADILAAIDNHLVIPRPPKTDRRAMLERVRSSPQMGVVSAFTFGGNYRACRMALTAAMIAFDEVRPNVWQRHMDCLSGGDKRVTRGRAQQLFPGREITHATADALLLAEYCRRHALGIKSYQAP